MSLVLGIREDHGSGKVRACIEVLGPPAQVCGPVEIRALFGFVMVSFGTCHSQRLDSVAGGQQIRRVLDCGTAASSFTLTCV